MPFDFSKLALTPLNSPNRRLAASAAPCSVRLSTGGTGGHSNRTGRSLTITVRDQSLLARVGLATKMNFSMATGVLPSGERVIVMWPDRAGTFHARSSGAATFVARMGFREWMEPIPDHLPKEAQLTIESFARGEQRLVVLLPPDYDQDGDDNSETSEGDSTSNSKPPPLIAAHEAPHSEPYQDKVGTVVAVSPPEPPIKKKPGRPPKAKESAPPSDKAGSRPAVLPKKDRMMVAGNALAQAMASRPIPKPPRLTSFESQFPPVEEPDVNKHTRNLTFSNGRQVHLSNAYDLVKVVFEVIRNQKRGMPSALSVLQRQLSSSPDERPSLAETKTILADLADQLEKAGVELHCSTDLMYAIRINP